MPLTLVVTGALNGRHLNNLGPKPLWMVSEHERVFDCQLRVLNRDATERPIVVGGFEVARLRGELGHVATVVENREWEDLGCACSAQVGLYHARPGRVVLAHGDVLYSPFRLPASGSWVVTSDFPGRGCGEVGVTEDSGWVAHMEYGLMPQWAQAVILDRRERELFEGLSLRRELLYEALNRVVDEGGRFGVHRPSGLQICDIDKKTELAVARSFRKQFVL